MTVVFRVLAPGALTTVQDLGRPGYARVGIPRGGACDQEAAVLANQTLGNDAGAPVLEITFAAPVLEVLAPTVIAVSPGPVVLAGGEPLSPFVPYLVRPGDRISGPGGPVASAWRSMRAYLAVLGGFDVPNVLGGRGTYLPAALGGLAGRALQAGDTLAAPPAGEREISTAMQRPGLPVPADFAPPPGAPWILRFIWGPDVRMFDRTTRWRFVHTLYQAAPESDRTGIRLSGERIVPQAKGVPSGGVTTGTLQVPPEGNPILLLPDHQTTGGYPVIGVVINQDLPKLGRITPQDHIMFVPVALGRKAHMAPRFWRVSVGGQYYSVAIWEESTSTGAKGSKAT